MSVHHSLLSKSKPYDNDGDHFNTSDKRLIESFGKDLVEKNDELDTSTNKRSHLQRSDSILKSNCIDIVAMDLPRQSKDSRVTSGNGDLLIDSFTIEDELNGKDDNIGKLDSMNIKF